MTPMLISQWLATAELGPKIRKRRSKSLKARRRCRPGSRWDASTKKCVRVKLKQRNQERKQDSMRQKHKAKRRRQNRQRARVTIGAHKPPRGDLKRMTVFVLLSIRNQASKDFDTKTVQLVQDELKRRGVDRKYPLPDRSFNPWKD